jgi:hypothetical protein
MAPEQTETRTRWLPLLPFVLVVLGIALTRAPFLPMRLAGEEGEFGGSIVNLAHGQLPRAMIARARRGTEMEIPAGHNLGGYLLLAAPFTPVLRITGFNSIAQRTAAAVGMRGCAALLYGVTLVLALLLVAPERRWRAALMLLAMSLPALPLLGSVQINYDGAISPLVVVGALWLARRGRSGGKAGAGWLALAGLFSSFGKLEFAAAIGAAIVIAEAVERRPLNVGVYFAALAGGLVFWRLVDPTNFKHGAGLVTRYWEMQGGNGAPILSRALDYSRRHLGLFWPMWAALGVACVVAPWSGARAWPMLSVALALLFIIAGYHAVAWRGDDFPRYFAACFPLVAILLAELSPPRVVPVLALALIAATVPQYLGLCRDRSLALNHLIHSNTDSHAVAESLEIAPRACMTVTGMDAGVGFYSGRAAFACCFAQWTDFAKQQDDRLCR